MDWTAGYASDVEYTAGFYGEQSPTYLNFVSVLNGYEPVALDRSERPFTYFELGFGRGLTVNLLAAANANGRFYAADFNPAHVAGARALAAQAELDNLTLLENSFADLAQGLLADLPQFDFITLHGIYTWVTAENRQHIVNFISRYLKPGGTVYVSYNAMPGWSASLPLQRLLVEYGDNFPNRSDVQLNGAATFIHKLADAGAAYFSATNVPLQPRLQGLKTHSRNYLVHEYMHKHWQPMYHADVARDMAGGKLEYAGSAELSFAYTKLFLNDEKRELLDTLTDPAMRETLKDYFLNTAFRKDVYIRGARKMGNARRRELLNNTGVALMVPRSTIVMKMPLAVGEVTGDPGLFDPVCDALVERPHTLAELAALPALQGRSFEDIVQVAALLTATRQAQVYDASYAGHDPAPARRMNQAVSSFVAYGDEYSALCSQLLGNGFAVGYVARMVFWLLQQPGAVADAAPLARKGWTMLQAQGRQMNKDGAALTDPEENLVHLRGLMQDVLDQQLPVWRQLGML